MTRTRMHSKGKGRLQVAHGFRGGAQLDVSQPGDAHEREAEHMAERVRSSRPGAEPTAEKRPAGSAPQGLLPDLGPGRPLDPEVRTRLEPHLGRDLEEIRVHTGTQAEEAASAVQARAFTVGRDVVFGAGRYQPATREGLALLAHEATHVGQQAATGAPALQRAPDQPAQFESKPSKKADVPDLVKAFFELPQIKEAIDNFKQRVTSKETPTDKRISTVAGAATVAAGPLTAIAVNPGARALGYGLLHDTVWPVPGLSMFQVRILADEPSEFDPRKGFPKPGTKLETPSGFGFMLHFGIDLGAGGRPAGK